MVYEIVTTYFMSHSHGILIFNNTGVFLTKKNCNDDVVFTDFGGKVNQNISLPDSYRRILLTNFPKLHPFDIERLISTNPYFTVEKGCGTHKILPLHTSFLPAGVIARTNLNYISYEEMFMFYYPICTRVKKFLYDVWGFQQLHYSNIEQHDIVLSVVETALY